MAEMEESIELNIIRANSHLSYNTYFQLIGEKKICSPINLHTILSLLSQDLAYRNRSRNLNIILQTLGIQDIDVCVKCYQQFQSFLRSKLTAGLSITNELFLKKNYLLQNDFKDLLNHFHYETGGIDEFSTKDGTVKYVNSWFEDKTDGIIGNVISSDIIDDNTLVALLNATHFKGNWATPFTLDPNPMTFHVNENESLQTPMMKIKGEIACKFNDRIKTIELPLEFDDFSLLIILPKIPQFIRVFRFYLENEINVMDKKEVEVCLPKFELDYFLNYRNIFSKLQLNELFSDDINIFDMIEGEEILKYSQLYEKSFIKIDEIGLEAASGLSVTLGPSDLEPEFDATDELKMSELNIKTVISNRFAKTLVTSRVQNKSESAKEATFTVILPDTAFITEFVMEINGTSYKSYIKGTEEAKAIYEGAVKVGRSAGIIEADTRDSNKFVVSVNLESHSTAVFLLTYEELLQRIHDQYELVLNICLCQIVDDINVEVNIKESRPLKFVKTPSLRTGQEADPKIEKFLKPPADIKMINSDSSIVKFRADAKYQRKLSCYLGTPVSQGFSGQFVVQYDVERDPKDGEILLQDGFFVHFFAPNDLDPLPKHVVFVLDTSGSMRGRKITQLQDAMMRILNEIRKDDLISIIEFNSNVIVWDIITEESITIYSNDLTDFAEPFAVLSKISLPTAAAADDETISKAKRVVQRMYANHNTFIIGGIETGLYIINANQQRNADKSLKHQPLLVFLTDGRPNVGISGSSEIVHLVTRLNLQHNKVPIFSLSFGEGARKALLRELSLKNFGFSKHIYEAADASIQLQSFYQQISSPLLSDVKFKYASDATEITRSQFPIYFGGGELVVSGQYTGLDLQTAINGYGPNGYQISLGSIIKNPVTSLERLWAYLTVKQTLEERKTMIDKKELTKKAVELAMKYSFVTEVTSLVVVKPEEVCRTDDDADKLAENVDEIGLMGFDECKRSFRKRMICGKKVPRTDTVQQEITEEKPKPLEFIANHPFLVALRLKKGDRKIILYLGLVSRPTASK